MYRRSHILPTAACLAWLVLDLGARSKVLCLCVLINHSEYTSQARIAAITIHKILQDLEVSAHLLISESCSEQLVRNNIYSSIYVYAAFQPEKERFPKYICMYICIYVYIYIYIYTGWGVQSWTTFCGPTAIAVGGCERKY